MSVFIQNQTVLIVGASSGIGRAATVLFAREGAMVVAAARREDRLQALKQELAKEQRDITVRVADASKPEEMQHLARTIGKIDILVFVAGTNTPDRSMERLSPEIWNTLVEVNLNGAFYATHAVLPSMRSTGAGHLIYISSISGLVPDVSGAAYQAAKRGVVGLAHAIRVEERQNGIRTCVICPGLVATELMEKRLRTAAHGGLAKSLNPEDVAEAVLAVAKLHPRVVVREMQILPPCL